MSGFLPSLETVAKGAFATAAGLATLSAGLIYYGQNYLIYPSAYIKVGPDDGAVHTPSDYGLFGEEIDLRAADGVLLRCYLLPQRLELPRPKRFQMLPITPAVWKDGETDEDYMARRPTVIMFHGNGGNVGHRIPLGMMFQQFMRCNVLMVSYRGYGNSEGSPSERGFQMDAQAALDFVLHDPRFGKTPIILYGQSIGGAVSIDLASRNPDKVESLILENTFTSLPALVPHVLPLLSPFTFLCHQKWESEAKIFGYLPEGQGQNLTPNQSQASTSTSRRVSTEKRSSSASGSGSTPGTSTSTSTSDAPVVGGARSHKDKRYKGIPRGTRVLLLSGKLDQIVPPEHMLALKTAFKERTKTRKSLGLAPSPFLPRSSSAASSSSLGLRKTPSSTRSRPREEGTGGMTFSTRGRTSTLSSESSFSSSISTGTGEEEKWEVLSDDKESEKMKGKEKEVEEKEEEVQIQIQGGEDDEPERSRWEEFPSGSHNDTSAQAGYWNIVEEFVSEIAREWALAKERQSQRGRL